MLTVLVVFAIGVYVGMVGLLFLIYFAVNHRPKVQRYGAGPSN